MSFLFSAPRSIFVDRRIGTWDKHGMQTPTPNDGPQIQILGNVIGGRRYFGQCFACGSQFMSTHDRVIVLGGGKYCVRCGCAEYARVKGTARTA